jgi:hypothetical protein
MPQFTGMAILSPVSGHSSYGVLLQHAPSESSGRIQTKEESGILDILK